MAEKDSSHDEEKERTNKETVNVNPDVVGILINDRCFQFVDVNWDDGQNVHCHNRQTAGRQADQLLTGNNFLPMTFNLSQTSGLGVHQAGLVPEDLSAKSDR